MKTTTRASHWHSELLFEIDDSSALFQLFETADLDDLEKRHQEKQKTADKKTDHASENIFSCSLLEMTMMSPQRMPAFSGD